MGPAGIIGLETRCFKNTCRIKKRNETTQEESRAPEGPLQDTSLVHWSSQLFVAGDWKPCDETVRLFADDVAKIEHDLLSCQIPPNIVFHLNEPAEYISIQIWRVDESLRHGKLCPHRDIRHRKLNNLFAKWCRKRTSRAKYDTIGAVPASTTFAVSGEAGNGRRFYWPRLLGVGVLLEKSYDSGRTFLSGSISPVAYRRLSNPHPISGCPS